MTRFRFSPHWALLLLLYVAADFMDPSIPGVFFFDGGVLFVDGVVQLKSNASTSVAAPEPMPFGGRSVDFNERDAAANKLRAHSRQSRRQHVVWRNLKHDDSTSFASSSAPDSSPTPPLS
jgi:hypothetical protein